LSIITFLLLGLAAAPKPHPSFNFYILSYPIFKSKLSIKSPLSNNPLTLFYIDGDSSIIRLSFI